MTQNPIGLLEIALEISTAKANGCTSGACSCGEGDCLASGWEKFVPPLKPQSEQTAQQQPKKSIP